MGADRPRRVAHRHARRLSPLSAAGGHLDSARRCGVALVIVLFAPRVNGATRWIVLGPLGIQPSEPPRSRRSSTAALLERRRSGSTRSATRPADRDRSRRRCRPRARRADLDRRVHRDDRRDDGVCGQLPTTWLIAGSAGRLFPGRDIRLPAGATFLDPWADPLGAEMIQSMIAVGTGGVFGRGLMGGVQKLLPRAAQRLPSASSRRAGLIGTTLVLACFCVIAWRGLRTAVRAPDRFGAFYLPDHDGRVSGLLQHQRRARAAPTEGDSTAVRQRRRVIPAHQPGGDGHSPERVAARVACTS